jgi:hypothetical protein
MRRSLRSSLAVVAVSLAAVAGCDLLFGPPPVVDDDTGRPGRDDDDCDDDGDCNGGEFCDDGTCRDFATEGEGEEGEGEEGEGEPPPPPPPACNGAGCPTIVSLSINATVLGEFNSATVAAIVTDPDGVDDVIGGTLLDPQSGLVYGTFAAQGGGAYEIDVTWGLLNTARPIDFSSSTSRTLRARFFDQAGNDVFGDVDVDLACDDGGAACNAQCGRARCEGACVEDVFDTDDNCGSCGTVCSGGSTCERSGNGFRCVGGAGEGEGEPSPEYVGVRENGVVCGEDLCADSCCVDPFGGTPPTCGATCPLGGGSCDGPEDCNAGEECCFSTFSSACVPTGDCRSAGNREICVNSGDCAFDEVCCTDVLLLSFGVDAGACVVGDVCP